MKKLFNLVTGLVILNSALYLSGCSLFKKTDQFAKDEIQAQEFYLRYPGQLAKVCAQKFPVESTLDTGFWKTTDTSSMVYFEGSNIARGDYSSKGTTIVIGHENDTVVCRVDTLRLTRTITRTKVDTLKIKDMAALDSAKNYIDGLNTANAKLKQQNDDTSTLLKAEKHTALMRLFGIIGISILLLVVLIVLIEKII